ncbi:tRNA (guanosine(46)-N7)-methyltransferase TrmB [Cesiribacter andamanensis]|uniref:tRNA (guanine-N(7)-)-methyltransferase n=1 Tax=Cesiribacter andamanensis AMV16 TaxID=1279009 RepID=M7NWQ9_9BACT|nr:tRNA (guanosine(46)-N7)-methyltransferase TrmB [Cesiribacter andamanensis]EMR02884.1 tRNA (guanine-N(7)-)-methyltransferase [Cesiribacter andamanensis AMV16]
MRNKLARFADLKVRQNVLEAGKPLLAEIKGNWNSLFFKNDKPITLELACGRGEYTVGLGRRFPDRNFIGVDIKGARLFFGSREADEEGLQNVGFLRIKISDIDQFFSEDEVDQIWITFPDPRPRDRDEKRRLTHPRFLEMYQRMLKEGGWLHLKTDDRQFFDFTREMLQQFPTKDLEWTHDLYSTHLLDDHFGLQTAYEKRYLEEGRKINYLRCRLLK